MWGGSKERKQFQGPKAGVRLGVGIYFKKEKVANSNFSGRAGQMRTKK